MVVPDPVVEFIGIYDADSTIIGEVSYWIGARLGRTHCSLCELTHGIFTMKNEWKQCSRSLSVPFRTFHRNDAPSEALHLANGSFPIVLARHGNDLQIVLRNSELAEFNSSTLRFGEWLSTYVADNT